MMRASEAIATLSATVPFAGGHVAPLPAFFLRHGRGFRQLGGRLVKLALSASAGGLGGSFHERRMA